MSGNNFGFALCVGTAMALVAVGPVRAADYSKQKNEIEHIERAMAAAQTAPEALKYWDPAVVWDDMVPGEWHGQSTVGAHLTAEFASVKNLKSTFLELTVDADNRLAYAYSIQHNSWTDIHTNKTVDITVRQTDCYHRVGGKWLMVYQHASLPVDFSTGKVVTNESLVSRSGGF